MEVTPFVVPRAAEVDITFEPFIVEEYGLEGIRPAGWTEVAIGAWARASNPADPAAFIVETVPLSADELLGIIAGQAGLNALPERSIQREANGLTWDFYQIKLQGITVDILLAEHEEKTYFVRLHSTANDHDALFEQVLLPFSENIQFVKYLKVLLYC